MRKVFLVILAILSFQSSGFSQASLDAMVKRMEDPNYALHQKTDIALVKELGAEAVDPLSKLLSSPDPQVRRNVLVMMKYAQAPEAVPIFIAAAEDFDHFTQRAAIDGLTPYGMDGFKALIAALEDPDAGLRQALQSALRDFEDLFPTEAGPMELNDPLTATVNGGLVIGPSGEVARPYKLQFTTQVKNDQILCRLTINDLIVRQYDRDLNQEERVKAAGPRELNELAESLSKGRFIFVVRPNCTTGGSARIFKAALPIIREAKRTDIERANWISGLLGLGANNEAIAAIALGPDATPETIAKLAHQLETESPKFRLMSDDRGVSCTAFNVPADYCLRKFEHYFRIRIEGSREGLRTPRINQTAWMSRDMLINTFADHVGATLTKEEDVYRFAALPQKALRDPVPWEVAWQSEPTEWAWLRPPVAADGKAILMTKHAVLTAFDLRNGKPVWESKLAFIPEMPCAIGNVLYAGGGDNDMYAVRITDGKLLWKYQAETPPEGDIRINHQVRFLGVHKKIALFSSTDNHVYAIDTTTGTQAWAYKPDIKLAHLPVLGTVSFAEGVLFFAGVEALCAVSADTQEVLWINKTAMSQSPAVTIDGAKVFVSGNGIVTCFSAEDGNQLWQCDTERKGSLHNAPAFGKARMFITGGRDDNFVYCLDIETGRIIWKTNIPGRPGDCALRGGELLLISDGLYTLDTATGQIVEKRLFDHNQPRHLPIAAGPLLLACSRDPEAGGKYGRGLLTAYRPVQRDAP